MRKLFKRWYVWLALFLLLGLATSAALIYSNPSRISQANFDRIQNGMNEEEVDEILGDEYPEMSTLLGSSMMNSTWYDGPSWISINWNAGKVSGKEIHLASTRETLKWYTKMVAWKIGVKCD